MFDESNEMAKSVIFSTYCADCVILSMMGVISDMETKQSPMALDKKLFVSCVKWKNVRHFW
jgi:hypothetical protein